VCHYLSYVTLHTIIRGKSIFLSVDPEEHASIQEFLEMDYEGYSEGGERCHKKIKLEWEKVSKHATVKARALFLAKLRV